MCILFSSYMRINMMAQYTNNQADYDVMHNYHVSCGQILFNYANILACAEEYEISIEYYLEALEMITINSDDRLKGRILFRLARAYIGIEDISQAIDTHLKHIRLSLDLNDALGVIQSMCCLTKLYKVMGKINQALPTAINHYIISRSISYKKGMVVAKRNINELRNLLGLRSLSDNELLTHSELFCSKEAYEKIDDKNVMKGIFYIQGTQAYEMYVNCMFYESIDYYKINLKFAKRHTLGKNAEIECLCGIAACLIKMHRYDEAIHWLNKIIQITSGQNSLKTLQLCAFNLEEIYLKKLNEINELIQSRIILQCNKNSRSRNVLPALFSQRDCIEKQANNYKILQSSLVTATKAYKCELPRIELLAHMKSAEIFLDVDKHQKAIIFFKYALNLSSMLGEENLKAVISGNLYKIYRYLDDLHEGMVFVRNSAVLSKINEYRRNLNTAKVNSYECELRNDHEGIFRYDVIRMICEELVQKSINILECTKLQGDIDFQIYLNNQLNS